MAAMRATLLLATAEGLLHPPPLLTPIVDAAIAAASSYNGQGKERDGSWCCEPERLALEGALRGLHGRKLAWWLDAPRPLRALVASGPHHEVAIICLPGGLSLPPAAYPSGSVLFAQPLVGQLKVRRLRLSEVAGSDEAPIELMSRSISAGGEPLSLLGGCVHEWSAMQGIASAMLQVVLLPPTSRFPSEYDGSGAVARAIGWTRPPADASDGELCLGEVIDVAAPDLMGIERRARDAVPTREPVESLPELQSRLREEVGGLDAQLATIARRALAARLCPPQLRAELGVRPVRGMLLYRPNPNPDPSPNPNAHFVYWGELLQALALAACPKQACCCTARPAAARRSARARSRRRSARESPRS
jgi:hypothetical protein